MSTTRTAHTLRNARVSLFFAIASFAVSFLSRRFFIDGLGVEVIGLRTTIGGFLSMLSLAELGIGTSIGVALYKPLFDQNHTEINEIISMQGWLYRIVASIVMVGALVMMLFFPRIFADMESPLWYAYALFGTFLLSSILSYTVNYKTIVLSADQKGYKVSSIMSSAGLLKSFTQMLVLYYIPDPFIYWISLELALSLVGVYVLDYITRREYPWLKIEISKGRTYLRKYPLILKRTGQIFFHSIASLAISYTTPLVLFSISTLAMVGGYDNYKNLITNIRTLANTPFTNLGPGVGNLIAEGNDDKTYAFFWEMHALKFFIAGICGFGIYQLGSPFIGLWLGSDMILGTFPVLLIALVAYIDFFRGATDAYIVSYGLFKDIWAPIVEAALNISISIICGILMGWEGALIGSLASLIVMVVIWKPYFLFSNGFQRPVKEYWMGTLKFPIVSWAIIIAMSELWSSFNISIESYAQLALYGGALTAVYSIILFAIFYTLSQGFRAVSKRLMNITVSTLRRKQS